ncbi:MAG: heme-binding protein [Amphiplicatus sp.]
MAKTIKSGASARAFLAVSFVAFGLACGARAQELRPALTTDSAKTIVAGCESDAVEKGVRLVMSVVDQGRDLMAFLRMDGAPPGAIEIAPWKANSAASFPRSTKAAAERAKEFPAGAAAPNIAVFEGGEPIFTKDGVHIGAVGVSGAAAASEDGDCARAGVIAAGLVYERPKG